MLDNFYSRVLEIVESNDSIEKMVNEFVSLLLGVDDSTTRELLKSLFIDLASGKIRNLMYYRIYERFL